MHRWQLQEAKARFSELVKAAECGEPQEITVRGRRAAIVVSAKQYDRMRSRKPTLLEFLRRSPLAGLDLDVIRDRAPARRARL